MGLCGGICHSDKNCLSNASMSQAMKLFKKVTKQNNNKKDGNSLRELLACCDTAVQT